MDTEQLLDGIFGGKEDAQLEFVEQYSNQLTARARRILHGLPPQASGTEVAQSVMGRFLMKARHGREQDGAIVDITSRSDLDNFLYRCVLNRAINEKKKTISRGPKSVCTDEDLIGSDEFQERFGDKGVDLAHRCVLRNDLCELNARQSSQLAQINRWLNSNRQRPSRVLSLNDEVDCIHESELVAELVNSNDDPSIKLTVQEAFKKLDSKTQGIVSMRLLGGYKLEEIARHVGVSVPTVRHRLEDALDLWGRTFGE